MKRLLAMILVFVSCFYAAAFADVLADDWQNADIDELLEAQQSIANRISELRAAVNSDIESVELAGEGTSIISNVEIPFAPSRVKITSDSSCSVKLTGGAYDHYFDCGRYEEEFFGESGTYTALIETSGAWSIVVEPIKDGGTFPLYGSGPYVSDFIELPAPMIVTIAGEKGKNTWLSNFIVSLHHQYKNISSWQKDSLTNELFTKSSEPFAADVILQPVQGRTQYCISIICDPGVTWSIIPKN